MSNKSSIEKIDEEIELDATPHKLPKSEEPKSDQHQESEEPKQVQRDEDLDEYQFKLEELLNKDGELELEDEYHNEAKDKAISCVEGIFSKKSADLENSFKKQLTTYFPNTTDVHIDYVIFYKTYDADISSPIHAEKEKVRRIFFEKLNKDHGFESYPLKYHYENKETFHFVLLNCSNERLMGEAENIKLEMTLKDENQELKDIYEEDDKNSIVARMRKFYTYLTQILDTNADLKRDNFLSAPFDYDIRHIFEDYINNDDKIKFTNSMRYLLVNNILRKLHFYSKKGNQKVERKRRKSDGDFYADCEDSADGAKTSGDNVKKSNTFSFSQGVKKFNNLKKKFSDLNRDDDINGNINMGLQFMISEGYFLDAFILHAEKIARNIRADSKNAKLNKIKLTEADLAANQIPDNEIMVHDRLKMHWAKIKNLFKFQPLNLIREYFGEYVTIYFAWCGTLVGSLWFPALIGLIFFIIQIVQNTSNEKGIKELLRNNSNASTSLAVYGDYYLNVFVDSFDSDLTPAYAVIICLWGALLCEYWKRKNSRLSYEWDTINFEHLEQERLEYTTKSNEMCKKLNIPVYHEPESKRLFRYFVSFMVLIFMVSIVGLIIALVVVYRIHMKIKVFPNDPVLRVIIGDIGSTLLNIISTITMNKIYRIVAKKLTNWENPQTQTDYHDSLILKNFAFEFINCYGSLFYIAFFRKIEYAEGLFGLGKEYQDSCDKGNCMALLTIQVLVVLIIKPFTSFSVSVIIPFIQSKCKKIDLQRQTAGDKNQTEYERYCEQMKDENEAKLFFFLIKEYRKKEFEQTIQEEYMEKIIMFGYVMLFACSFSLGPLLYLIIVLIDIRIDSRRIMSIYRRPIPHRAQDIGMFLYIFQFLNICGIMSNSFIIAFTSNWSNTFLNDNLEDRLQFVVIFEHVIFFLWILIFMLPDTSRRVKLKMKQEAELAKAKVMKAKSPESKLKRAISSNIIDMRLSETKTALMKFMGKKESSIIESDSSTAEAFTHLLQRIKKKVKPQHQIHSFIDGSTTNVRSANSSETSETFRRKRKHVEKISQKIHPKEDIV